LFPLTPWSEWGEDLIAKASHECEDRDVRILLQHRTTKHFLQTDGTWSTEQDNAFVFDITDAALDKCWDQAVPSDIVVAFMNHELDIKARCH